MKKSTSIYQQYLVWPLLVFLLYFLVACGSVATSKATVTSTSTQPTVATTLPTKSVNTTNPAPLVVDLTALKGYIHPDNRFSVSYPGNWETFEQPQGVVFVDTNDQAGYSVVFTDVGQEYNDEELNQYLLTFIAQNFGSDESNFKAISREQQPDGTVTARFSSIDPNLGPSINEVRVLQADNIVYVLNASAVEEQWPVAELQLGAMLDTFTPLDTTSVQTQTTPPPPEWVLIGPTSQEFGFLYASDWTILEQEENRVSVAYPTEKMTFTVSNFPLSTINIPTAPEIAALAHLEELNTQYEDVQNLPPAEFRLDTATGSTVDFIYVDKDGTNMAGSIITAVANNKIHKVVFTAPTDFYDAALQWFNTMYQSVKFLDPENAPPIIQEQKDEE